MIPFTALLFILAVGAAVAFFWLTGLPLPESFSWKDVQFATIGTTLLGFLLIALFVERVMEVYTSVWRAPERQKKIIQAQRAQARVEPSTRR